MEYYNQRKQNPIEYRDLLIENIILESAPFDQVEITIVTDKIILKKLVVHYQTNAILILFIFLLNTKTFTN